MYGTGDQSLLSQLHIDSCSRKIIVDACIFDDSTTGKQAIVKLPVNQCVKIKSNSRASHKTGVRWSCCSESAPK